MRLLFTGSFFAFALSAYAVVIGLKEYGVARLSLQGQVVEFETLLYDPPSRALSLRADRTVFLACHDALVGLIADLQPAEALGLIAETCQAHAEGALASAPGSSLTHYTLALTGNVKGDDEALNNHLLASQKTGVFESWLAKRRFKLALETQSALDANGRAAFLADISSLLQSSKGRTFIARYYARRPDIRDDILDIADHHEERIKGALVKAVEIALHQRAGGS